MNRPEEDHELADFQLLLTQLMADNLQPEEIVCRLRSDARAAPFANYVDNLDTRCVEVTAMLMRRWGRRV
jgi:hypothetical protein